MAKLHILLKRIGRAGVDVVFCMFLIAQFGARNVGTVPAAGARLGIRWARRGGAGGGQIEKEGNHLVHTQHCGCTSSP